MKHQDSPAPTLDDFADWWKRDQQRDPEQLPVVVELFAGSLAMSRAAVGAPMDLVAWLGGKRRVARLLLQTLGLRPRQPLGGLLFSDAGPWGWVWPILLDVETRKGVVAVLRSWASRCPACAGSGQAEGMACGVCARAKTTGGGPDASDLWRWIASQPPRADLAERTAGWLWLQARAASGAAIWWNDQQAEGDWRQGSADDKPDQPAGERNSGWRSGRTGRQAGQDQPACQKGSGQDESWRMGDKGGRDQRAYEAGWRMGEEKTKSKRGDRTISQKGATVTDHERAAKTEGGGHYQQIGQWQMSDGRGVPREATEKGRGTPTRCRGIVRVSTLADRIEHLDSGRWPLTSAEMAEIAAAWVVLQTGNGRGKPVEVVAGSWRTAGFAHLTEIARAKGFTSRLHLPRLSNRIDAVEQGRWPAVACFQGSALDALPLALALGRRARVLLDPPYHVDGDKLRDRTGYGADLPLEDTLQMAAQLADGGAPVTICEGGPLHKRLGPGWHAYNISDAFSGVVKGEEWITTSQPVPFLASKRQQTLF